MKFLGVLIRREFWEHRGLWITPLVIAAALFLLPMLFGQFTFRVELPFGGEINGDPRQDLFAATTIGVAVPFFVASGILTVVYLLDCLYGERRDRSILFWKSLPVSDTQTVLTKYLVAMVIVPLGTFAVASVTSLLVLAVMALRAPPDLPAVFAWDTGAWLRSQLLMLYGVAATMLWYAPYGAYLLLASAWARRSVYAWALLPPLLAAMLERLVFGTHYFGRIVQRGFGDLLGLAFRVNRQIDLSIGNVFGPRPGGGGGGGPGMRGALERLDPATLLSSTQLWIGLAATALMLWLAIGIRRRRDES